MPYFIEPEAILRRAPKAVAVDGVYVIKADKPENDNPGVLVVVVRMNGKFYSIQLDSELSLDGFHPKATLLGPLK